MALLRSVATIASLTMVSRVLGLLRDVLTAFFLGAGPVADAFFVAFRFPNFFRALFAEGAFSAAFVPRFAATLAQDGNQAALQFAQEARAVLAAALSALVAVGVIFMPWLMPLFAPGFSDDPEQINLTISLARITFPYLLFVSLVAHLGGVLNALDRFGAFAASPIIMNVTLMASLLLIPLFPNPATAPAYAMAVGVIASGIAQWSWMNIAAKRAGVRLDFIRPRLSPPVRALLKAAFPAALGTGAAQVNILVGTILASLLPVGSVSYLYYADRISQLPLGVFGIAIGTALLPMLSRSISLGNKEEAVTQQNRAIELTLLLTLPAAVALMVIPLPIIEILFARGAFDADAAHKTALALAAFSAGLPAYVLIKALTPGFFARHDTKTPVIIAVITMVLNVAFNLLLMIPLAHIGIALGTALASWANAGMLAYILKRRGQFQIDARLSMRWPRIAASALLMGLVLYFTNLALLPFWGQGLLTGILALTALVLLGIAVFAALALAFNAASIADMKALWHKPANINNEGIAP
ncbi:MAG: murein biosynthesis integral membrane protein MurJ [Dongiaceae bacterium]